MKKFILFLILLALAGGGYYYYEYLYQPAQAKRSNPNALTLTGNIDNRQIALAFNGSGRITKLRADAGDSVQKGDVLGQLDAENLRLQAKQIEAQIEATQANARNLRDGARPEEIARAKSAVAAAQAQAKKAKNDYVRLSGLSQRSNGMAVARTNVDAARAAMESANANLAESQAALKLLQAGSRQQEIVAAEANIKAAQAQLDLLNYQIAQTTLTAPESGVIRARLLQAGDMASPAAPVYTLALTDPKWIRLYVSEPFLGRITPGMNADISTDSGTHFTGKLGYISSVAEFTPKNVETQELRTALVYEIRVNVNDPDNRLRLGQPVTVTLQLPHD